MRRRALAVGAWRQKHGHEQWIEVEGTGRGGHAHCNSKMSDDDILKMIKEVASQGARYVTESSLMQAKLDKTATLRRSFETFESLAWL